MPGPGPSHCPQALRRPDLCHSEDMVLCAAFAYAFDFYIYIIHTVYVSMCIYIYICTHMFFVYLLFQAYIYISKYFDLYV